MKLLYIVTSPLTANVLLRGQLRALLDAGYDVSIISAPGPELDSVADREGVNVVGIPMEREISLMRDSVSLIRICHAIFKLKPDIVNASTPKAGLLGMLASFLVRVPARVFQQRGLRLETTHGMKYGVLYVCERLTALCATHIICNSNSLLNTYTELGLAQAEKLAVLGAGSSNGVDTGRFGNASTQANAELRRRLGIPDNAFVIGFAGRLTVDKGIVDLLRAFSYVASQKESIFLLLVGPFESGDALPEDIVTELQTHPEIVLTGLVLDTAPYYTVMDVLAFPSYREGFPNVPLEAAASGVATVGYAATGTIDAVLDGVSGMLVPVGDTDALARCLLKTALDSCLLSEMSEASNRRATEEFDSHQVWRNWVNFYDELGKECLPEPR